jgi:enoyl-CoA hydratase/carnithine racemase
LSSVPGADPPDPAAAPPAGGDGGREHTNAPEQGAGRVTLRREGAVAVVALERPEKLNALSSHLERSLTETIDASDLTSSGCVVITGGETVFSAGADLTEMDGLDAEGVFDYYRATGGVYEKVASLRQPSISAISGYCLGGGFELALATDFRIADESAVFGLPEVGIGIVPSSGGIHRLVRIVGPARARELVLARPRFSASEALALGLVTEVVPAGEALPRALELARRLAELPALASELARRAIDAAAESSRSTALFLEQLAYAALAQPRVGNRGDLG